MLWDGRGPPPAQARPRLTAMKPMVSERLSLLVADLLSLSLCRPCDRCPKSNDALRSRARRIFDGGRCTRHRRTKETAECARLRVRCRDGRGLLALPAVDGLARSQKLLDLVRPHVAHEPSPVRAIYFDKSPEANWLVPWHQDLTLALRSRAEVPGFGPWSSEGRRSSRPAAHRTLGTDAHGAPAFG